MSGLREAQLRQEFRSEIMRGYQAALCNGGNPDTGWTLGDEVGKVADNLLASIAAHPVEPAAGVSDEAVWRSAVETEMGLRGYSEDEVEAARTHSCKAFGCEWDWNHSAWVCVDDEGNSAHPIADEYGELVDVIGRALEAAQPFMGATPVASRERVAEVLADHQLQDGAGKWLGQYRTEYTCDCGEPVITNAHAEVSLLAARVTHQAAALLAAGVFREPPTREALIPAIGAATGHVEEWDTDEMTGHRVSGCHSCAGFGYPCRTLDDAVDAALALFGGEPS